MQKMEKQPTLLVLTSFQKRIPYCFASKGSKYLLKNSLPDVFLFQLKILVSYESGLPIQHLAQHFEESLCVNTVLHSFQTNYTLQMHFHFIFTATASCFDNKSIASFFL